MGCKALVFSLILSLFALDIFASDTRNVAVVRGKKAMSAAAKFYRDVAKKTREAKTKAEVDLLSLTNLTVGVKLGLDEIIKTNNVHHDIDKIYHDVQVDPDPALAQWNRFRIGAKVCIPLFFSIPNIAGALGINVGAKIGWSREYELHVRTKNAIEPPTSLWKEGWAKFTRTWHTLGRLKLAFSPKTIGKKYFPGTVIRTKGMRQVLTKLGVNVGIPALSFNTDMYGLLESNFDTILKVLDDPLHGGKRQLFRYIIKTTTKKGAGISAGLTLGIKLFETSVINGVLKVNLLSTRKVATKQDIAVFDYSYDISYPRAEKALKAAMQGNLVPTQKIAIFRDGEKNYKGVIINQRKTEVITEVMSKFVIGLHKAESAMKGYSNKVKATEDFGGFLYYGVAKADIRRKVKTEGFYREKGALDSFRFPMHKKVGALWGLLGKADHDLNVYSKVVNTERVIEGSEFGVRSTPNNKITFSYRQKYHKYGKKATHLFLKRARRILGWHDKEMGKEVGNILESRKCLRNKATLVMNASFYDRAIRTMVMHTEREVWTLFGHYMGLKVPSKIRYKSFREKFVGKIRNEYATKLQYRDRIQYWKNKERFVKGLKKKYAKYRKEYLEWRMLKTLNMDLNDLHKLIKKYDNFEKEFMPRWRKFKALGTRLFHDRSKLAEMFKDLYKTYELDPSAYEFMIILAGGFSDKRKSRTGFFMPGLYVNYYIDTGVCKYNWFQKGDFQFRHADAVKDYQ